MPVQPLNVAIAAKVDLASPSSVEDAAARISRYLAKDRWLGSRNRYLRRTMQQIKADAGAPHDANEKHLAEYMAASAVLHTSDGWSYLGRAIGAQCRGDMSVARHLGYYAELRAALGLLSSQGIAIVSQKNVVLKGSGDVEFFDGQTHNIAWRVLDHWSNSPRAASLLSTLAQVSGVPLADWVLGLGLGTGGWSSLGTEWLRAWGLDLRMFGRDREARNEASYRPTMLRPAAGTPKTDAAFVQEFWPLFEPVPGEPFRQVDLHLLRLTLERAFTNVVGQPAVGRLEFHKALERTLGTNAGLDLSSPLGQFLGRRIDAATPVLFDAAASRASHLDPHYHAHVISRAALLLRVSTGATMRMLAGAQIGAAQYRFWTEAFAESHGICEPGGLPADPADLWADVADAMNDLAQSVAGGADRSFFSLLDSAAHAIEILSGCERVALWGLAA